MPFAHGSERLAFLDATPSILLISWNRSEYIERVLPHLLADPADFRLYLWDNGSDEPVRDLIATVKDDRIALRRLNAGNAGQKEPWFWFMENAKGDIAGKLDDDILGDRGWMTRLSHLLVKEPQFGTLGGWIYLPSDWDERRAAHKVRRVGEVDIFQNLWVAGCMMLARTERLRRYSNPDFVGTPISQYAFHRAGYVNGYPLPLVTGENLDDPRNPACRMNRPGGWDQYAAYTARRIGMTSPEEYGRWIAQDALNVLDVPVDKQLRRFDPTPTQRLFDKAKRRLTAAFG